MNELRKKLDAIEVSMPAGEYNYEWELDEMLGSPVESVIDAILQALPEEGDISTDPKWNQARSNTLREVRNILNEARNSK